MSLVCLEQGCGWISAEHRLCPRHQVTYSLVRGDHQGRRRHGGTPRWSRWELWRNAHEETAAQTGDLDAAPDQRGTWLAEFRDRAWALMFARQMEWRLTREDPPVPS